MREVAMSGQNLLVQSRHLIATSRERCALGLYRRTLGRAIHGANDGSDTAASRCSHDAGVEVDAGVDYAAACHARTAFARDAGGYYVSSVQRLLSGNWGWVVCPTCARP
jgi:hypothetical protein